MGRRNRESEGRVEDGFWNACGSRSLVNEMDLIDLGLWGVDIFARYGGFKGLWN